MTTVALNNLWSYLQGLTLPRSDREWLAGKLLEATQDEVEMQLQQMYVKDSLCRALDEVENAKNDGKPLQSIDEFISELQAQQSL